MKHIRFVMIAIYFIYSHVSIADEIVVGFGFEIEPYVISEKNNGIEVDIVRQALKLKGHNLKLRHMSHTELHIQLAREKSDIDASARIDSKYGIKGLFYSDNYIKYEDFAISLQSKNFVIHKISDLAGLRVIAWSLARNDLGADFKKLTRELGSVKYFEYDNRELLNKSFWSGKADVIVVDKSIFKWYRRKLNRQYNTSSSIIYHDIFPPSTNYKMAFKNKQYRDDFNEGLLMLRTSGGYEKIYRKYLNMHNSMQYPTN